MYELAFCDDCKTPHLLAEDSAGQLLQRSAYANDEFELSYEGTAEDEPGPGADGWWLLREGKRRRNF